MEKGLSNRSIQFATRDSEGFLWLVTSGIEKYDGHKFTRYRKFDQVHYLPVSNVNTAIRIGNHQILFSETRALYSFDLLSGEVKEHPFPKNMPGDFTSLIKMIQKRNHPDILMVTSGAAHKSFHVIDTAWNHRFAFRVESGSSLSQPLLRAYANGPSGVLWLMDEANHQILRVY